MDITVDVPREEVHVTRKTLNKIESAWLKEQIEQGHGCEKCGRKHLEGGIPLSYDHIVPQYILKMLGVDVHSHWDIENSSLLCRLCNNFKDSRLDFSNKKTKGLVGKYLERV